MSWTGQAIFQDLTIIASASITTSYVLAVVVDSPCAMFMVKNGTNGDVLISFDGTTNKLGFPSVCGSAYDVRSNSPVTSNLMLPQGTAIFVKWNGSAPGAPTGNLYLEFMEVAIAGA